MPTHADGIDTHKCINDLFSHMADKKSSSFVCNNLFLIQNILVIHQEYHLIDCKSIPASLITEMQRLLMCDIL